MEHNHGGIPTNTPQVFTTFIGCTVKGVFVYFDARSHRVLVFECGWGLVICDSGAFWIMNPEDIKERVRWCKSKLVETRKELEGILSLAGEEK